MSTNDAGPRIDAALQARIDAALERMELVENTAQMRWGKPFMQLSDNEVADVMRIVLPIVASMLQPGPTEGD
jgi:hypothetical protein